jgi:hypothetical protein
LEIVLRGLRAQTLECLQAGARRTTQEIVEGFERLGAQRRSSRTSLASNTPAASGNGADATSPSPIGAPA